MKSESARKHPKVLVIDIGGSNVKLMVYGKTGRKKFRSGPGLTPRVLIRQVTALTRDWEYDAVSIGFPAPVFDGKPAAEPSHLGRGWAGYDFQKRFKKPVKLINDAAMQALGSYEGGRMLFLGLGTGLGSALVVNRTILPLELCNLPDPSGKTIEGCLCKQTLKVMGKVRWQKLVHKIVETLQISFLVDYVVLGGGNAKHLREPIPDGVKLGANDNAFLGGHRLWDSLPFRPGKPRKPAWVVA